MHIVIPNLNGQFLESCLISLFAQTKKDIVVIVVDNASSPQSLAVHKKFKNEKRLVWLPQEINYGFAGGVNIGLRYAMKDGASYIALCNNDMVVDKNWTQELQKPFTDNSIGIAVSKQLDETGKHIDSTGEIYSTWGLSGSRGRGEEEKGQYDQNLELFAAPGGASAYRTEMLRQIGLFDNDFFAYYEDIDISFRAQLYGWGIRYAPKATVRHKIGATSSRKKGFTTYQTFKNLPLLLWKNVPSPLIFSVAPRMYLVYWLFFFSAITKGNGWPALKGACVSLRYLPKKLVERRHIQKNKKRSADDIRRQLYQGIPPSYTNLHSLKRKLLG